jgi:hypothetical protein
MENECYFVSSRGILKSCDFHSSNPKDDFFKDDYKHLDEMLTGNKMYDGMTIYLNTIYLSYFIENILTKINNKFTLISGDSDNTVPDNILNNSYVDFLLNNKYLIKWFSQNSKLNNNKCCQLPIGLDYHSITNNPHSGLRQEHELSDPIEQEKILQNIRINTQPFYNRELKIFVNFSLQNDRFHERADCINMIPKELLIGILEKTSRTLVWTATTRFSFVLSPKGNGMDCHRTWEILCLGSIPIVKGSEFNELFSDLPVLIVNEWSDVNEQLLKDTIIEFKKRTFNYTKLTLKYWIDKMKHM